MKIEFQKDLGFHAKFYIRGTIVFSRKIETHCRVKTTCTVLYKSGGIRLNASFVSGSDDVKHKLHGAIFSINLKALDPNPIDLVSFVYFYFAMSKA